jgi:putative Holliday junction resolvase
METTPIGRWLGIDYGSKRIGLALSDEMGALAFSHATLDNDAAAIDAVVALIKEKGVIGIVMGDSKDFAMTDNPIMAEARTFADKVSAATGIVVDFEPEFLTSHQARTMRHEMGATATRGDGSVDAGAAALILQTKLDRLKNDSADTSGPHVPYNAAFDDNAQ